VPLADIARLYKRGKRFPTRETAQAFIAAR
jgi:hypothetical protein